MIYGRLLYAITPRFAPTSSPEQMAMAQRLKEEYPDTWVHTHLSENKDEIIGALAEMYQDTLLSIISNTDEEPGNLKWEKNW